MPLASVHLVMALVEALIATVRGWSKDSLGNPSRDAQFANAIQRNHFMKRFGLLEEAPHKVVDLRMRDGLSGKCPLLGNLALFVDVRLGLCGRVLWFSSLGMSAGFFESYSRSARKIQDERDDRQNDQYFSCIFHGSVLSM